MRPGCLGIAVAWGLGGLWIVTTVLVIFYAPGSWVTGFVYGFASVAFAFWLALRSPAWAEYAGLKTARQREIAEALDQMPKTRNRILLVMGSFLTAACGLLAALFFAFALAAAREGDFGPNLTATSMGFGIFLAITIACWHYFLRTKLP
jgi:hypothetical protein